MTKSTEFLGSLRETQYAEILSNQVPEIKSVTNLCITHNTNVSLVLCNTQATLPTTAWKQSADFELKCSIIPDHGVGYLDYGSVTCVAYPNGFFAITGHTTAVVAPTSIHKAITFTAGKYGSIKRMLLPPANFNYGFQFSYTDKAGLAVPINGKVSTTSKGRVLDFRRFNMDRSIVANLYIVFYDSADSVLALNGAITTSSVLFYYLNDAIRISFDVYNELDVMNFGYPPIVDEAIKNQIMSYLSNYKPFLELDASALSVPVDIWASALATGCAYSIANGWTTAAHFNDLHEVRNLSLALVGLYSKIASGLFLENIMIPEHFADSLETYLSSKVMSLSSLLLLASIWALADELELEAGLV